MPETAVPPMPSAAPKWVELLRREVEAVEPFGGADPEDVRLGLLVMARTSVELMELWSFRSGANGDHRAASPDRR